MDEKPLEEIELNFVSLKQDLDNASIGQYGTYLVASKLWGMGFRAVLTSRNTKGVDLYIENPKTRKVIGAQVKTFRPQGKDRLKYFTPVSFGKPVKIEELPDFLYDFIFVEVQKDLPERFYVVPKTEIKGLLRAHWEEYRGHKHRIPYEEQAEKPQTLNLFVYQMLPFEDKWENIWSD